MSKHSIAEARNNLSNLIARAEKGEEVVITRHGMPTVTLTPCSKPVPRVVSDADLDWLKARRSGRGRIKGNAGISVSHMRDEEWH
ncbi:MAG: type II toxin-antitoxin system prevent-host-death family antitoxin [Alphaproteobacteria bacterium]|nr:type II toxin-antitoxin system prevent-host-death family antitoxin [Alphaproteobacteria bacterium]